MPKYKIGLINKESEMEEWQKEAQGSAPNLLVTVGVIALLLALIYYFASWVRDCLYKLDNLYFSVKIDFIVSVVGK